MKNCISCVCLILVCIIDMQAQNLSVEEWNAIQASGDYLIGMGMSKNLENARLVAFNDLAGKISSKVESQFSFVISQKTKGEEVESITQMNNIIKSYSSVTLNNVSEYIENNKSGDIVVYRYMKNSELRAMFKRRVNMAKKWARDAAEREYAGKIGDALQNYYWALALLRSCPDGDLETFKQTGKEENMLQGIFTKIKDILSEIRVKAIAVEPDGSCQRLILNFTYKGKPAINFNYKYYDGKHYSSVYRCKDGYGDLKLPPNAKLKKIKIYAEYECREEANIHPELCSVMEQTPSVPLQVAEFKIDVSECSPLPNNYVMQIATSTKKSALSTQNQRDCDGKEALTTLYPESSMAVLTEQEAGTYITTVGSIEEGIAQHNYTALHEHFTNEGWDMFEKLIKYGDAKLLNISQIQFIKSKGQVICRSIPMSFTFKGNSRTFTEDVILYFNKEGKVCEVAFGLENIAVKDIMGRGEWSEDVRQIMIHFLETYKTAYALKRWDYINSIFSDEALIITGTYVKSTGNKELGPTKTQHIKYTQQTKEQYMNNLKKCFSSNEYINLHFADNIVRRSNTKPNIYGIQIKQDYFSSTYGDTGYLFLLIDFANQEKPIIHVRTWQPDKDPNVRDGRIGIADFIL